MLDANILKRRRTTSTFASVLALNPILMPGLTPGQVFQDSAGTTAAAVGDPVGLEMDVATSYGSQLLLNDDFEQSGSNWSVTGEDATHVVTFDGNTCRYQSDTTSPVLQLIQTDVMVIGRTYLCEINVSEYVSGSLKIDDAAGVVVVASKAGVNQSVIKASGTSFVPYRNSSNVDLTMDSIKLWEITTPIFTQSDDAKRPILVRQPARGVVNLLTRTEEFNHSDWVKTATGTGAVPIVTSNFEGSADKIDFDMGGGGTSSDTSYIQQAPSVGTGSHVGVVKVKAATSSDVGRELLFRHVAFSAYTTITLTEDYQTVEVLETGTNSLFQLAIRGTFSADQAVSCIIEYVQLEAGSTATAYQKVVSQYDVTENGTGVLALEFDGTDDQITTAITGELASNTNLHIVFDILASDDQGIIFGEGNTSSFLAAFDDGSSSTSLSAGVGSPTINVAGSEVTGSRDDLHTAVSTGTWRRCDITAVDYTTRDEFGISNYNEAQWRLSAKIRPPWIFPRTLTASEIAQVHALRDQLFGALS